MEICRHTWSRLGITEKFSLTFGFMLTFMLLIAATSYFSFRYIELAEQKIRKSTAIEQLVLEMDRGLERARRLHGSFFLQYRSIGLQAAHEAYAQPSVRQIAEVISLSNKLKKLLFQSGSITFAEIDPTDVNLYLSSAKRFAETSIEAVELISRRAAPERGLEAQVQAISQSLQKELQSFPDLSAMHGEAGSFFKDYLVSRQRYLMQSSLNALNWLHAAIELKPSSSRDRKASLFNLIDRYQNIAAQLLDVDLAISHKLRDFSLQDQVVSPLSQRLIQKTQKDVVLAQQQINNVHKVAGYFILGVTLLTTCIFLYFSRLMHKSITKNVLEFAATAGKFSAGHLDVRVQVRSRDELGQLGNIFNTMAERLKDLVENLEKKVARRTAELSASEKRFRKLVNDLPKIAVQGYDSERNVVYWNHASETLYGFNSEEALGKKIEELIIPGHMEEKVVQAIQDWLEKDIAIPAAELTLHDKYGHNVPVYSSHVMMANVEGERTMYCVDIDLADLKLAQEEGRRSEFFYRQLFTHSTSGVAVYEVVEDGQDFIFKDLNKAGEKIDGINRDEAIGHSVTEIFSGMMEFGILDILRQVWQTGEPAYHPVCHYKKDGRESWHENRVYKMPSGEIVAVYDDITAQKHNERDKRAMEFRLQRAQKMEAIGLLAGGVAHDLNNLLSAIVGYPEILLLDLPEKSALRRPLEAIKEAGDRATAVVADLLTVARGVASVKEPTDLNNLVREYTKVPEFLKLQSNHPDVIVKQQLSANLPPILCSPVHVKKSILNLMTNGAEAIVNDGIVTISTTARTPSPEWAKQHGLDDREYVVLSISDTGNGIQQKDIDHIFEPFYTKKVMGIHSGTGLGLSVVWNTMQDHNGTVLVFRKDRTTTFELYFPATDKVIPAPEKNSHIIDRQGKVETILVVDDEHQQRNLAKAMLETLGYKVICRDSGENALIYLQEHHVDLVLLDMLMDPGLNGRETYERMIKMHPGLKAVIASGFSESDEVKAALKQGADRFIQKPYSIDQLGQAIKIALHG